LQVKWNAGHQPANREKSNIMDKEIREIDLAQWQQVGEGGNGKTYVARPQAAPQCGDPDGANAGAILKISNSRLSTLEAVRKEFDVSRAVHALGLATPEMREIVRVGDAYGTISELIKPKRSLGRICCDNPERTEEMATLLCTRGKELFATPCDTGFFPSRKAQLMQALGRVQFVGRKTLSTLEAFAQRIPDTTTCLHGDFQMGNLILSGERHYWIDLDRFGYGDPMFDVGHLYMLCNVYSSMKYVQGLFHVTRDQFHSFWDAFARAYTGSTDHADFDREAARFACFDVILRYAYDKPNLPEKLFFSIYIRRLAKNFQN
jgi:uncharacterized protein (TIGR02172 family)